MVKEAGFQVAPDIPITPEGLIGNSTVVTEKLIRFHG